MLITTKHRSGLNLTGLPFTFGPRAISQSRLEFFLQTLYRLLHARQLGLKLIANVTYGYTAANFSGRMPCIEVSGVL